MEQLPPNIEQVLTDLESNPPMLRQAVAVKLGRMTTSNERIVAALEKAAAAGGTPDDGSAQAAAAAATALSTSAHREMLTQMGIQPPWENRPPLPWARISTRNLMSFTLS